jgi:hypothetical protein
MWMCGYNYFDLKINVGHSATIIEKPILTLCGTVLVLVELIVIT